MQGSKESEVCTGAKHSGSAKHEFVTRDLAELKMMTKKNK